MKKLLLLMLCTVIISVFTACNDDDDRYDWRRGFYEEEQPSSDEENQQIFPNVIDSRSDALRITKLYSVVMRRELPYPFKAYVMQLSNGQYFYMLRYRFNQDLKVGDEISFSVYSFCRNEIAQVNNIELGTGSDVPISENSDVSAGDYLIASNPIEATVKNIFDMKIRYSITFWPIDTWFIETTDGNLVFVKKSKLKVTLNPGDRFVYNVYTLFPNEILAIKKL